MTKREGHHPLSTDPKSSKSQQGSDVLSSETETQQPQTRAQIHPSFYNNLPTHNGHFLWDERTGRAAGFGVGVWAAGGSRTRG